MSQRQRCAVLLVAAGLMAPAHSSSADAQTELRDSAHALHRAATALRQQRTAAALDSAIATWHEALRLLRLANEQSRGAQMLTLWHRAADDTTGQARVLAALALAHAAAGRPDSSLFYDRASRELRRDIRIAEAAKISGMGNALMTGGRPDSAMARYRLALGMTHRQIDDTISNPLTLNNIGVVFQDTGHPDSAAAYYHQALRLRRALGDSSAVASSLHNIAWLFWSVGQLDSALYYFRSALPARRAVAADRAGDAGILLDIGALFRSAGQPDSALAYIERALAIRRELGLRSQEAEALQRMSSVLEDFGRPDEALAVSHEELRIYREDGDSIGAGMVLGNIGAAHMRLGRLDSARFYMNLALAVNRVTGSRGLQATLLKDIGGVFEEGGQLDSAIIARRSALELSREDEDLGTEAFSLFSLAQLHHRYESHRDLARAVAYYDSAAALTVAPAVWSGIVSGRAVHSPDEYHVTFGEIDVGIFGGWVLATLARASETGAAESAAAALAVAERGRARALLRLMAPGGSSVVATTPAAGADLTAEGRRLAASVVANGTTVLYYFATADTLLSWLALPSGEILLERRAMPTDTLAAWIAAVRRNVHGPERGLVRVLATIDAAADAAGDARSGLGLERANRRLADVLLPDGIRARIADHRELLIVPYGPIALISFAALPVDSARTTLGSKVALRYAPSLSAVLEAEARNARTHRGGYDRVPFDQALVVGNPAMPEVVSAAAATMLEPLPGAEREGRFVARRVGASAMTGTFATETAVRAALSRADLVHLATHALAFSAEAKARDSFIALAADSAHDGLLSVGELLDDASLALRADLVVLSACQTGMGMIRQAEGTVGLQRAFLARGARSVLVSLWSVDDRSTALLMERFYTHWLDDADRPSKAEALRRAQQDVRSTPGFESPLHWAGFQLVGAR